MTKLVTKSTPSCVKSSFNKAKTRTYPGSNHDLVLSSSSVRFHLEKKLQDQSVEEVLKATTGGKFATLTLLDYDVDTFVGTSKRC